MNSKTFENDTLSSMATENYWRTLSYFVENCLVAA